MDDDGDGLSDYPEDPGCGYGADDSERGSVACDDGVDDDADGNADFPVDRGCAGPGNVSERGSDNCDNGVDDDADGRADFPADSSCESPEDDSEWPHLGPSCAGSQLEALARLCSAQLRCRARDVKGPDADRLEECLSGAEDRLTATLGKLALAAQKAGGTCRRGQATALGSELEAATPGLAAEVLTGAEPLSRADATLRAALTRRAGGLCEADLRTLGRELTRPSADSGDAARLGARERFLRSASKALEKAEKAGASYDGPPPDEIADALRSLAEDVAAQLAP